MIDEIISDAEVHMKKSIEAMKVSMKKIRTGRAHPSILDAVQVEYYGSMTPLSQLANVSVEDARLLSVTPWEAKIVPDVERAIMKSDLGLNPSTAGSVIRVPMPMLTEETRRGFIKQAKQEAEAAKVSIRNARRDGNSMLKSLVKDKEISEDDERRAQDVIQKETDAFIAEVDNLLQQKERDLLEI